MCHWITLLIAFEIYWPYVVLCSTAWWLTVRTLWNFDPSEDALAQFRREARRILAAGLRYMAIKALMVALIGGSLLLALGAWICRWAG